MRETTRYAICWTLHAALGVICALILFGMIFGIGLIWHAAFAGQIAEEQFFNPVHRP